MRHGAHIDEVELTFPTGVSGLMDSATDVLRFFTEVRVDRGALSTARTDDARLAFHGCIEIGQYPVDSGAHRVASLAVLDAAQG